MVAVEGGGIRAHRTATVSVIIPVKDVTMYAREAIGEVRKYFPECEILLIPDHDDGTKVEGARIIASWPIAAPGEKRDLAVSLAEGEIVAFLDDDAFPAAGWLSAALPHFDDDNVAAVGGPAVTPVSNSPRQRASGWVLATFMGSARSTYRYRPGKRRDVDDLPSVNLFVRRSDFDAVGGFECGYWPGEDTELCRKLGSDLKKRIVYEPEALVFHHRRPVFRAHLRQQARYGLHRGHFARRFQGNSRRISYAIPALFTTGLLLGPIVAGSIPLGYQAYATALSIYAVGLLATGVWVWYHDRDLYVVMLTITGILATHIAYGLSYIRGALTKELIH